MTTDDFFRARLDGMVDLRHPLAVLSRRLPWAQIEDSLAPLLVHRDRAGRSVQGAYLFGTTLQVAGGGVSNAGRPRLAIRLMVALLYLKHAYNLSDEALVAKPHPPSRPPTPPARPFPWPTSKASTWCWSGPTPVAPS
jgi:transposase, IS5 family